MESKSEKYHVYPKQLSEKIRKIAIESLSLLGKRRESIRQDPGYP